MSSIVACAASSIHLNSFVSSFFLFNPPRPATAQTLVQARFAQTPQVAADTEMHRALLEVIVHLGPGSSSGRTLTSTLSKPLSPSASLPLNAFSSGVLLIFLLHLGHVVCRSIFGWGNSLEDSCRLRGCGHPRGQAFGVRPQLAAAAQRKVLAGGEAI
jgi:hypothetical protein